MAATGVLLPPEVSVLDPTGGAREGVLPGALGLFRFARGGDCLGDGLTFMVGTEVGRIGGLVSVGSEGGISVPVLSQVPLTQ